MTPVISERDFQKTVLEAARALGWRTAHFRASRTAHGWRTPVEGDGQGFPDVVAVRGDRVLWLELKSESGRLSEEQGQWLAALGLAGQEVHCVRPSDWAVVEEILR